METTATSQETPTMNGTSGTNEPVMADANIPAAAAPTTTHVDTPTSLSSPSMANILGSGSPGSAGHGSPPLHPRTIKPFKPSSRAPSISGAESKEGGPTDDISPPMITRMMHPDHTATTVEPSNNSTTSSEIPNLSAASSPQSTMTQITSAPSDSSTPRLTLNTNTDVNSTGLIAVSSIEPATPLFQTKTNVDGGDGATGLSGPTPVGSPSSGGVARPIPRARVGSPTTNANSPLNMSFNFTRPGQSTMPPPMQLTNNETNTNVNTNANNTLTQIGLLGGSSGIGIGPIESPPNLYRELGFEANSNPSPMPLQTHNGFQAPIAHNNSHPNLVGNTGPSPMPLHTHMYSYANHPHLTQPLTPSMGGYMNFNSLHSLSSMPYGSPGVSPAGSPRSSLLNDITQGGPHHTNLDQMKLDLSANPPNPANNQITPITNTTSTVATDPSIKPESTANPATNPTTSSTLPASTTTVTTTTTSIIDTLSASSGAGMGTMTMPPSGVPGPMVSPQLGSLSYSNMFQGGYQPPGSPTGYLSQDQYFSHSHPSPQQLPQQAITRPLNSPGPGGLSSQPGPSTGDWSQQQQLSSLQQQLNAMVQSNDLLAKQYAQNIPVVQQAQQQRQGEITNGFNPQQPNRPGSGFTPPAGSPLQQPQPSIFPNPNPTHGLSLPPVTSSGNSPGSTGAADGEYASLQRLQYQLTLQLKQQQEQLQQQAMQIQFQQQQHQLYMSNLQRSQQQAIYPQSQPSSQTPPQPSPYTNTNNPNNSPLFTSQPQSSPQQLNSYLSSYGNPNSYGTNMGGNNNFPGQSYGRNPILNGRGGGMMTNTNLGSQTNENAFKYGADDLSPGLPRLPGLSQPASPNLGTYGIGSLLSSPQTGLVGSLNSPYPGGRTLGGLQQTQQSHIPSPELHSRAIRPQLVHSQASLVAAATPPHQSNGPTVREKPQPSARALAAKAAANTNAASTTAMPSTATPTTAAAVPQSRATARRGSTSKSGSRSPLPAPIIINTGAKKTATKFYPCPHPGCQELLKTRFSLKRHMKKHTGEKPHVCPYETCGKSFPEASTLKRHLRIHTGEKPFKCSFIGCEKAFADATNVKRHEMTHTGEKPYRCLVQQCSRSFSRGSSLRQHMVSLHHLEANDPTLIASVKRGRLMKMKKKRLKANEVLEEEAAKNTGVAAVMAQHGITFPSVPVPPVTKPKSNNRRGSVSGASGKAPAAKRQKNSPAKTTPVSVTAAAVAAAAATVKEDEDSSPSRSSRAASSKNRQASSAAAAPFISHSTDTATVGSKRKHDEEDDDGDADGVTGDLHLDGDFDDDELDDEDEDGEGESSEDGEEDEEEEP